MANQGINCKTVRSNPFIELGILTRQMQHIKHSLRMLFNKKSKLFITWHILDYNNELL